MRKKLFLISAFFLVTIGLVKGQSAPPLPSRTLNANVTQGLSFGDMAVAEGTSGGTVSVDYTGIRTSSPFVYLLNMGYPVEQGILEFHLCPGRVVNVVFDSYVYLRNGSNSVQLDVGPIRIGNTIITSGNQQFYSNKGCNDTQQIEIGGTLHIGSSLSNPSGEYTGSFNITLAQQ